MNQTDLFDAWVEWALTHGENPDDLEAFDRWVSEGRAQ